MADIVVAVPTFKRPQWLTRLLRALESLETTATLSVLVADNDDEFQGGRRACDAIRAQGYRWPIDSIVVKERGISQARNALIGHALRRKSDAFFLAMLDDDEWPSPFWLNALLAVQNQTGADIVQGPVTCQFAQPPSAWAMLANANAEPRPDSGRIAMADAGGNVLLRSECLARLDGEWFDPQFGLTGGEDKDFFQRMARLGARFAWAADAVAYTSIPESRMTLGWAVRRAFRAGNCDLRIIRKYDRRLTTAARESAKTLGALVLSPPQFLLGLGDPRRRARAVITFARALGKAAVPLGGEYREYKQTHGR